MDRINDYSDQELIEMLRNGSTDEQAKAFEIVYLKHKKYAIGFMRSKFGDREEIQDIYQDAVIVLRENVNKPDWELTCSIQTYLNSVCYYQGLTAFKNARKKVEPEDEIIEILDWLQPMEESLNDERKKLIVSILEDKAKTSEICYDILTRRFYQNQSYKIIALAMEYKNERTAINRGHVCMEKLREEIKEPLGGKR
jgi:RNA polymerase sigma factor (sigma-70 family)